MNESDFKASEWDNNPLHWDQSKTVAKEIKTFSFETCLLQNII